MPEPRKERWLRKPWELLTPVERDKATWPSGFARKFLGLELYPKQMEVMDACAWDQSKVALRSPNESGKTSRIAAGLILWHLVMFRDGQVVSTAGTWRQVKDQLIPNLKKQQGKFPRWRFLSESIAINGLPRYVGFSTRDSFKFEGYHGTNPMAPLLIVVDEAKGVSDGVFEAIERCNPNRLLVMSSPGYAEGEFYRIFIKPRGFNTFHMSWKDVPHITEARVREMEQKWGEDHPLVRSMIYGDFMESIEDAIISLAHVERCLNNPPDWEKSNNRHCFCDFARGGDENVVALRVGNKIEILDAWREKDTLRGLARFVEVFSKHGLKPEEISGDAGGMGAAMIDSLRGMNWPINEFQPGSRPWNPQAYRDAISEVWFEGALKIEKQMVLLPEDDELRGQLISRKRWADRRNNNRLAVEPKDEMRRRGLPSPDRADAVLGAMAPCCAPVSRNIGDYAEDLEQNEDDLVGVSLMDGMNAGDY